MPGWAARVPLPLLLAGALALSMAVPSIHALGRDEHREAQTFFYSGVLLLALIAAIATAAMRTKSSNITRSHLVALLTAFTVLPAMAALPMAGLLPDTTALNLYFEMVAAMTTTGGSLFTPDRLSDSGHLWRAMVAWQGGFLVWVAAIAILAPLNLGGFEVADGNTARRGAAGTAGRTRDHAANPETRVARAVLMLAPVYAGLTALLWIILVTAGDDATTAVIHAMSTLSTSGITNAKGPAGAPSGLGGEVAVALFLVFALSRQTFSTDMNRDRIRYLAQDRELRIAGMIVGAVTAALFLRHWIGAWEVAGPGDVGRAAGALWGAAFTVLSYLTTTGFESAHWQEAQQWSGLGAPTVLLLGLAMFGGGVATTAGGVKLLRIYALYAHGSREMALLVHPHAIERTRAGGRGIPTGGIEGAWVFFMLFATTIAGVTLALTISGLGFEEALALAVACLTTTGPLAETVLGGQGAMNALPDMAKIVAAATMVLGRLEALALIALLNPDFWRD